MPLDFPNSPTVNQVFNASGVSWMWDGVKWTSVLSSGGPFLPLSGGTVTGNLDTTGHIRQGYATNPPTWANGPGNDAGFGWAELIAEAQFYTKSGGVAVSAMGRASDYHRGTETPQIYAFVGYGVADVAPGTAEAMYLEATTTVPGATAICIEMDSINTAGAAPTMNSYQLLNAGASVGLVIAAGGGPGRPGPIYNSSAALAIGSNRAVHNNGIVFGATSLNGTDGVTGTGIAVQMAKGHEIQWTFNNTGARSSFIRSDATAPSVGIAIESNGCYFVNATTEAVLAAVSPAGAITGASIGTGGVGGPTWTTGSAAPASPQPVGSLYSRVGGAVGATLYVSRGAGTWAAVAGV